MARESCWRPESPNPESSWRPESPTADPETFDHRRRSPIRSWPTRSPGSERLPLPLFVHSAVHGFGDLKGGILQLGMCFSDRIDV